jgi:hypothetical protein
VGAARSFVARGGAGVGLAGEQDFLDLGHGVTPLTTAGSESPRGRIRRERLRSSATKKVSSRRLFRRRRLGVHGSGNTAWLSSVAMVRSSSVRSVLRLGGASCNTTAWHGSCGNDGRCRSAQPGFFDGRSRRIVPATVDAARSRFGSPAGMRSAPPYRWKVPALPDRGSRLRQVDAVVEALCPRPDKATSALGGKRRWMR